MVLLLLFLTVLYGYAQCPNDTEDPMIIPPADVTLGNDIGYCSATLTPAQLSYPIVFDQCGILSVIPTGIPSGYVFPVGSTTITWVVTDYSGNSATANQTVTIIDTEPPSITCPTEVNVTTNTGACDAYVNLTVNGTDNCSVSTVSNDYTTGGLDASGTYPIGTTIVTFTITDSVGLTSTCNVNVNVINADSPTVTLTGPNNVTIEACDTYTELGATAFDSCLGDISSDIFIDTSNFISNQTGTYTIEYSVVNAAGISSAPVTRTVTVVDTTPPSLNLIGPSTLTIGNCSTYTELGATAIDPCFGDISENVTITNSTVDTSTLGSYTVTYTVVDNSGNSGGSITRTVNVIDNTPPEIVLLGDNPLTLEACDTYTELGATAIDPCFGTDYSADLLIDTSELNIAEVGTYQVTYNVTDAFGNSAIEATRTIEVVDTTPPEIVLLGDNPQMVSACTPYTELGATAIDTCSGIDYSSSIIIDASNLNTTVEGVYQVSYSVCDATGNCSQTVTRDVQVLLSNDSASAGDDFTNTVCTDTTISLAGNPVIGTATSGLWTVTSGQTSGYSFSNPSDPNSTFTGDIGETYTLTWTIDNPEPCPDVSDSINVTFINCSALDFDGVDDNITFRNNFNLNSEFSLELWMKSETQNNTIQTIISKRAANHLINGYDLRVVNNYISFNWNNGETLSSAPYQINTNQWHHIAVTLKAGVFKLYIDGIEINSTTGTTPIANTYGCIVGGMFQTAVPPFRPIHYFDGGIDELRIWNVALTASQIRKMMNQEIENNSGNVYGKVIPIAIEGLSWNDLNAYYKMNQSSDLNSGYLLSSNGNPVSGLLRYMTTLQAETAPLPYLSTNHGTWTNVNTWLHGNVQAIPNSIGIDGVTPVNWNIVKTQHNISSGNNNLVLLGLYVSGNTLTIENTNPTDGQSIRVTDYLKIDSTLKLMGESQLIQDSNSIVDYTGTGVIHRDQQGTSNLYNYNYWGSPVSANGTTFTVGSILHEGTQPVLWTTAYNANPNTSPITMSSRWLYLYENYPVNSYADWLAINENSSVSVGLGFLMKGSGTTNAEQNYTFIGKPNNGTITSPITANNEALVGNPYPSAIDANEFIMDNSSSILGTLYFWEHYASNNTHVLADYQGGYATYNLTGGNAAVSPPEISGLGAPSKIPERYIPVAQGFTVIANTIGGQITFENDQRIFVKETVTGTANNGSVFMRSNQPSYNTTSDIIKRLRLKFTTPQGANRHLLLGFVPENAADDAYNYGYDALNTENLPDDMSWSIENNNYVIQGVGNFDTTKMYPLFVKLTTAGNIQVELTTLENFDEEIDVYIYDAVLNTSFRINDDPFQIFLNSGDYSNRFFITFLPNHQLSVADENSENIFINYLSQTQEILIKLPNHFKVNQVELINLLGQKIFTWESSQFNRNENTLKLPLKPVSEGTYIVNIKPFGTSPRAKKIIISY